MTDRGLVEDDASELDRQSAGLVLSRELHEHGIAVSDSYLSDLDAAGVSLTWGDLIHLRSIVCFAFAAVKQHGTAAEIQRQQRIRQLSEELLGLLSDEHEQEIAVVGDCGFESGDFETIIETSDVIESINALNRRATEKLEQRMTAASWPFIPGSNRADRIRFAYWLALMAFWHFGLRREIRTSIDPETNSPGGPLVRFIALMTGELEPSLDAIRKFIREHKDKALDLAILFDGR